MSSTCKHVSLGRPCMCRWVLSSDRVRTDDSDVGREAKSAARPVQPIVVYTDGSAFNNGKKHAKAGYAVVFPDYPEHTRGYPLEGTQQTNNRAEYMGAITACAIADAIDGTRTRPLHIYTDSQLLINTATKWIRQWRRNGWKKKDKHPVANLDLVQRLDALLSAARPIKFIYVQAHAGNHYNEQADALAKQGVLYRPTS
jgi:ribonuclease HI